MVVDSWRYTGSTSKTKNLPEVGHGVGLATAGQRHTRPRREVKHVPTRAERHLGRCAGHRLCTGSGETILTRIWSTVWSNHLQTRHGGRGKPPPPPQPPSALPECRHGVALPAAVKCSRSLGPEIECSSLRACRHLRSAARHRLCVVRVGADENVYSILNWTATQLNWLMTV